MASSLRSFLELIGEGRRLISSPRFLLWGTSGWRRTQSAMPTSRTVDFMHGQAGDMSLTHREKLCIIVPRRMGLIACEA